MKKTQTHMMYGFLTGLAMIIVQVLLYVLGFGFKPWSQWIVYIPFLLGLVINAKAYSKANEYRVAFGNVWSSGFKASAIVAIVLLAWGFISLYVFPEMREKGMEMAREKLVERNMSDEQIDQALQMTKKFFVPFMIAGTIFSTMFVGAILSAIAAAFPKKLGDSPLTKSEEISI
ncbi:MAG: DUF4199 domain-containing protein [Bacteroidetes bacterium]|nr:DUF4199 domain-containing protein [Bacteroidota bacterium]